MPVLNRIYYLMKPFVPRGIRVGVRRLQARSKRLTSSDLWPIDEKAGGVPPGWPGWPLGKRFAFILTHDVEGNRGLSRVEQLMELDMKHGFRSSFNFVPEYEYRLSDEFRQELVRRGFEVGVHGLKHDGKLYSSRGVFASNAARIKEYLQKWNAVGFRSPLMQHKLGWLHQLGVEYDSSTFDTDPFEPQPDGAGTIFPFWVSNPNGLGYVELPYTLAQDHTLFAVLGEQNIDIWKQKIDWIAARGGMALLNTHPDYMCFKGTRTSDEFPISYYEELLSYVREKYEGAFWHALPREVAHFYCEQVPRSSRNSRKKICMLSHNDYDNDNRVRRYAESLVKRGDQVDVIVLASGNVPVGTALVNGVTVYRVQHRKRDERSKWTYAWRLLRFFVKSSILMTRLHQRNQYDLIHVHNVPDFMVFTAWYPKWTGVRLILDIHDIVPEFFASKFSVGEGSRYVRLLKLIEKASMSFADHVIVSNHLWHEKLIARSVSREKSSVFLNHVDPAIFYQHPRTRTDNKLVIIFPGSFQWHQGLDIAIEAFVKVKEQVPNAELHLYGGGSEEENLVQMVERLGLKESVKFGGVSHDDMPGVIVNADVGIVPKRANSFGNEAYSTKIMEFMSQGIPVVASRTKIDTYYFDDTVVRFFESGNADAMADAILAVMKNPGLRESLIAKGYEYIARNSWDVRRRDYFDLVDSLTIEAFDRLSYGEEVS